MGLFLQRPQSSAQGPLTEMFPLGLRLREFVPIAGGQSFVGATKSFQRHVNGSFSSNASAFFSTAETCPQRLMLGESRSKIVFLGCGSHWGFVPSCQGEKLSVFFPQLQGTGRLSEEMKKEEPRIDLKVVEDRVRVPFPWPFPFSHSSLCKSGPGLCSLFKCSLELYTCPGEREGRVCWECWPEFCNSTLMGLTIGQTNNCFHAKH